MTTDNGWFVDARYGLFIHYGLYSLLGRGEWVMNRERLPQARMRHLMTEFTAAEFDADRICDLAVAGGMRVPNVSHPPYDPCQSDIMR